MPPVEIESVFTNAFRSNRLIYRPMEKNEADKKFVGSFWIDPLSRGLCGGLMFYDRDMQGRQDDVEKIIIHALLSIVICLPPEENQLPGDAIGPVEQRAAERANSAPNGMAQIQQDEGERLPSPHHGNVPLYPRELAKTKATVPKPSTGLLDWGFNFAGFYKVETHYCVLQSESHSPVQ